MKVQFFRKRGGRKRGGAKALFFKGGFTRFAKTTGFFLGFGFLSLLSDARKAVAYPTPLPQVVGSGPVNSIEVLRSFYAANHMARTCAFLELKAPWLKEKIIQLLESGRIKIYLLAENSKDDPYECAYSKPSWVTPSARMHLRPIAFHAACRDASNIIFHELLHMSWTFTAEPGRFGWGSEEQVAEIDSACEQETKIRVSQRNF